MSVSLLDMGCIDGRGGRGICVGLCAGSRSVSCAVSLSILLNGSDGFFEQGANDCNGACFGD